VNLRVVEKEDLPLVAEWENNLGFIGEYNPLRQLSKGEIEKNYDKLGSEEKWFFIEKKDGGKIGFIGHSSVRGFIVPFNQVLVIVVHYPEKTLKAVRHCPFYPILPHQFFELQIATNIF